MLRLRFILPSLAVVLAACGGGGGGAPVGSQPPVSAPGGNDGPAQPSPQPQPQPPAQQPDNPQPGAGPQQPDDPAPDLAAIASRNIVNSLNEIIRAANWRLSEEGTNVAIGDGATLANFNREWFGDNPEFQYGYIVERGQEYKTAQAVKTTPNIPGRFGRPNETGTRTATSFALWMDHVFVLINGDSIAYRDSLTGTTATGGRGFGSFIVGNSPGTNPPDVVARWYGPAIAWGGGSGLNTNGSAAIRTSISSGALVVDEVNIYLPGYVTVTFSNLTPNNGAFSYSQGPPRDHVRVIHGRFFGDDHSEVAGHFRSRNISGVFGAHRR